MTDVWSRKRASRQRVTEAREEEATGVTQKQWEKQKLRDVFSFTYILVLLLYQGCIQGEGRGGIHDSKTC
jgi:hypothetical protein